MATETHTVTVKRDPNDFLDEGLFKAFCSCGRFSSGGHESKTLAQGAFDRHIATVMDHNAHAGI